MFLLEEQAFLPKIKAANPNMLRQSSASGEIKWSGVERNGLCLKVECLEIVHESK
jgi:hypothetical protein